MGLITQVVSEKDRIRSELERRLSLSSRQRAENDHHAKRKPRPCGMTIHTGIGCSYCCAYCYIYDMGFPARVTPYPLTGLELAYALSLNPYVAPSYTFAAYGSVTEPFLPETRERAVEYISTVFSWLKLPSQVSTKAVIDEELAKKLSRAEPRLSLLVTVVTLERWRELEGFAPSPMDRLEGARIAVEHGLRVTLFVRPIIPGVTDREAEKIFAIAAEKGIDSVVLGTLRVTPGILARLRARGLDVSEIERRLPRKPRSKDDQVSIRGSDIKKRLAKLAADYGFKVFESACGANVYAHGEYCYMCEYGPCGDRSAKPSVKENDIAEYLESLGMKVLDIEFGEPITRVRVSKASSRSAIDVAQMIASAVTRVRICISS